MNGYVISPADVDTYRDVIRSHRSGEAPRIAETGPPGRIPAAGPFAALLLEDLPIAGEARAEPLALDFGRHVVDLHVVGHPPLNPTDHAPPEELTFTLRALENPPPDDEEPDPLAGDQIGPIPANATAAELRDALRSVGWIQRAEPVVTVGNRPGDNLWPMRWLIALNPRRDGQDWPTWTVETHTLGESADVRILRGNAAGTGSTTTVRTVLPIGDPTPLRSGAVVIVQDVANFGPVVTAAEPRIFAPIIPRQDPYDND